MCGAEPSEYSHLGGLRVAGEAGRLFFTAGLKNVPCGHGGLECSFVIRGPVRRDMTYGLGSCVCASGRVVPSEQGTAENSDYFVE